MTCGRPFYTCAMLLIAASAVGCNIKPDALPVNERPRAIVDASTHEPLRRVLIIPGQILTSGVSVGSSSWPKDGSADFEIAAPYVYGHLQPFRVPQPTSRGVYLPPMVFFAGSGSYTRGVTILTPTHRARWFWQLVSERKGPVLMTSLSKADAEIQRRELVELMAKRKVFGRELSQAFRDALSVGEDAQLQINLTSDERKMVLDFIR